MLLLVQRKMSLNTDRQGQHGAHHNKRHDPAARGQHLIHKEPSHREPEYTEPPRSAPDRVLAGIYGIIKSQNEVSEVPYANRGGRGSELGDMKPERPRRTV